jgi:hypothetical protein
MIAFVDSSRRLANRTVARTVDLFTQLREAIVEARETQRRLEAELLRNRYHVSSKSNDDLPVAH